MMKKFRLIFVLILLTLTLTLSACGKNGVRQNVIIQSKECTIEALPNRTVVQTIFLSLDDNSTEEEIFDIYSKSGLKYRNHLLDNSCYYADIFPKEPKDSSSMRYSDDWLSDDSLRIEYKKEKNGTSRLLKSSYYFSNNELLLCYDTNTGYGNFDCDDDYGQLKIWLLDKSKATSGRQGEVVYFDSLEEAFEYVEKEYPDALPKP